MDVMLDTNTMRVLAWDSLSLKAIRAFLRTTRSRLQLPSVMVEELYAHREREVSDLDDKLTGANKIRLWLFLEANDQKPVLDAAGSVVSLRKQFAGLAELLGVV